MSNNRETRKAATAELMQTQDALSLSSDELLSRLGTSATGLTVEESERRREVYGTNE